ncbi:hypothetical protein FB45DRAFT_915315 [Roridomyces roridus]|uniref:Uncharacterized protein n=1 Tax=Roridomyces roridus TaxID=1738132 RepID=A0AAD7B358_9AGAR|nr:hypothetical protein FB45DRAFT_949064 [Roridomyces roridus]KAJ7608376.1 hypothetical protein FB45DRAFT_946551 [Roridomyces roridus]KAJ7609825.1 hypothetical protein FB45DRAFT_943077 [Roridomyces roridus]KAJ7620198.1 hypothetical protein FB45DRAFT_929706 [Roridomyces roridus]KAJ7621013.1 hypothetical protein FB45DRAFT_928118 [Roridomyces roridus]
MDAFRLYKRLPSASEFWPFHLHFTVHLLLLAGLNVHAISHSLVPNNLAAANLNIVSCLLFPYSDAHPTMSHMPPGHRRV